MELRGPFDLDPFAEECVTPQEEYEQDILRRLTTRRGTNLDDLDFGENVSDWLSAPVTDLERARSEFEAEVLKDERTARCTATLEQGPEVSTFTLTLEIETNEGALVTLNLLVSEDGVEVA